MCNLRSVSETRSVLDSGKRCNKAGAGLIAITARERGLVLDKAERFDSASGIGVRGLVAGKTLGLGNRTLMQQLGVDVSALSSSAEALRGEGASVMHLSIDGRLAGLLAVSDPVKATASTTRPRWRAP